MKCMKSFSFTPEDVCWREEWIAPRVILAGDMVHLTSREYKVVGDSMRRAVAWFLLNEDAPEEESRGSISSEIVPLLDVGEDVTSHLWVQVCC